jgi:hypothetical protein
MNSSQKKVYHCAKCCVFDEFTVAVHQINEISKFSYQFWKDDNSFNKRSEAEFVGS